MRAAREIDDEEHAMDRRGFRDDDVQVTTARLESLRDGEEHADAGTVEVGRAAEVDDVPVRVTYTGLVPLVYIAQRSLMDGLKLGFVGDWILIAIVMTRRPTAVVASRYVYGSRRRWSRTRNTIPRNPRRPTTTQTDWSRASVGLSR